MNNDNNNECITNNNNKNNNNNINDLTYHYFDKTMKMPKRIKKYINSSNSNIISNNSQSNNNNKVVNIKTKDNTKNNNFRKQSNISSNTIKNDFNIASYNNTLKSDLNNNLFRTLNKKEIKYNNNKIDLDLITQDNMKLERLLRKIPSSRKFRDKSFDLMDYISKLRQYKNKYLLNYTNININIEGIYPPNDCDAFKKNKVQNIFD